MTKTNKNNEDRKTHYLSWFDPIDNKCRNAGVAFYNPKYGEYVLKIDEDEGRRFFLRPTSSLDDSIHYRMEMVLRRRNGRFRKRQYVGDGYSNSETGGDVHIRYGSKYATLVLNL